MLFIICTKDFFLNIIHFFSFFLFFFFCLPYRYRPISSDQLSGQKPTKLSFLSRTLGAVQERNAVVDSTEWLRLCRRYMYRFHQEFIYSGAGTRCGNHGIQIALLIGLSRSRYQALTIKLFLDFLRIYHNFLDRIISIFQLVPGGDFDDCRFGVVVFVISMGPAGFML